VVDAVESAAVETVETELVVAGLTDEDEDEDEDEAQSWSAAKEVAAVAAAAAVDMIEESAPQEPSKPGDLNHQTMGQAAAVRRMDSAAVAAVVVAAKERRVATEGLLEAEAEVEVGVVVQGWGWGQRAGPAAPNPRQ
jgi:hypothetical protein